MSASSSSNPTFTNRLRRECLDLQQNPIPLTCAGPTADSLKQWLVVFEGDSTSLYEGGTFFALLTFDDDYPFTPPTLEFKTRIYHCNIYQSTGLVKHDIFDKNWSPTVTIRQIIQKVADLLVQCEPDHCAMKELGLQYKHERNDYERMARLWTKHFAHMTSIYDSEQYLFEIAQSFIRSRVIFTSIELKIFDLLFSSLDGLRCSEIAKHLNLHYIEKESRCLEDVLDCLTAMNLLEREEKKSTYKLTKFTRNFLLPHRKVLTNFDEEFYKAMPQFHDKSLPNSSRNSINQLMLLRLQQLVDLRNYSNISIDSFDENIDAIILWRQDGFLKEKLQQAYDILPLNKKGLLILILPNDEHDEVTLALNLFLNMTTTKEQENGKDFYSKKYLKQIGFRSIEKIQSTDDLQFLLAFK